MYHRKIAYLVSSGLPIEDALLKSLAENKDPVVMFLSEQLHSGRIASNEVDKVIGIWFDNLGYINETNRLLSEFENRVTILNYILFFSFGFVSSSLKVLGSLVKGYVSPLFLNLNYNVHAIALSFLLFSISIFVVSSSYFNLKRKFFKCVVSCFLFIASYLFFGTIFSYVS